MARLGDICTVYTGTGFPVQYQGEASGDYPFFKVGDISKNVAKGNLYLKDCDNYISNETAQKIKGTIVPADTVVFAKIGEAVKLNRRAITSEDCLVDNNVMGINPNQSELCLSYFYYYMCNIQLETYAEATTVPSVKKSIIENLEIPLPTQKEQVRISNLLSKVDIIIQLRKQQLAKLDQLVKSRFIEMFGDPVLNQHGWQKAALEANATLLNGRAYKQDELLDSGKYPVLRVGNFFSNRGWYYSDLELDDDKYCDNGDLLYAWSASFGPQIWNGGKVIYHYHIWKVLVGEAYNKQFLCKLLEYATESLMGDTHGIAMMHLTKSGMEKTEFIVPPIELQEQFAAFVEQTDKSKLAIQQSLDKLETLKKSLMQEYFG